MDVTEEWWAEHGLWEGRFDKEAVEVKGKYLTHVVHVKVCPPLDRRENNPYCDVYGEISFNVGPSGDPVTLYRRHRDNPDPLDLSRSFECCYLALTDGHRGERPLGAVSESNPLYLTMKLYEKTLSPEEEEEEEEEDAMIACFENFEYYDPHYREDFCSFLIVPGELGFQIQVCYTVVLGVRAKVEVSIKEEGGGLNGRVPVWGDIAALQYLREKSTGWPHSVSETTLLNVFEGEEETYNVDEPVKLQRSFVVAPIRFAKYLSICIGLAIVTDSNTPAEREDSYVYFPLSNGTKLHKFITKADLTHTKLIEHSSGTVFSVTCTFFHPDPDDIEFSHSSFKRPRSLEQKHN